MELNVEMVVAILFGAGGGGGVAALIRYILDKRKRVAETDSIVVTGAGVAMDTMKEALMVVTTQRDDSIRENERLRAQHRDELAEKDAEIARKDEALEELREQLKVMQETLATAQLQAAQFEQQLNSFLPPHPA